MVSLCVTALTPVPSGRTAAAQRSDMVSGEIRGGGGGGAESAHTFQQLEARKGKCCQKTEHTSWWLTGKNAQWRQG